MMYIFTITGTLKLNTVISLPPNFRIDLKRKKKLSRHIIYYFYNNNLFSQFLLLPVIEM